MEHQHQSFSRFCIGMRVMDDFLPGWDESELGQRDSEKLAHFNTHSTFGIGGGNIHDE